VPQYSIKLCTYDPEIIDTFDRLRKNRKQAAFTHEALKYFLSTEKGGQVLSLMEGKMTELFLPTKHVPPDKTYIEIPSERAGNTSNPELTEQIDRSNVLESILK